MRRNKERRYNSSKELIHTSHKFVRRIEKVFKNLPKPLEWQSFYVHDLTVLMDICEEVREEAIRRGLSRHQIRALQKLREVSSEEFQRIIENGHVASNSVGEAENKDISQMDIRDLSGREIEGIADNVAKQERLTELKRSRVSQSLKQETIILMMRLIV